MDKKPHLTPQDYEYMNSLSSALLQIRPRKLHFILLFWFFTIILFIIWASFASIDEIARGEGEIVPSGDNQIVQNLEGGIIEEILVKEGQIVKKDQVLIKINNKKSKSTVTSNYLKANALKAKIIRLKAQANMSEFIISQTKDKDIMELMENEKKLYRSNISQLESKLDAFREQLIQKNNEIKEAKFQSSSSKKSLSIINQEIKIISPMVKKGLSSKIDLLSLKREKNSIEQKYKSANLSIPRLKSETLEIKNKIKEAKFLFQSKSREELSEAIAKLQSIDAHQGLFEDEVFRTDVRSPMDGIVQKLYIHTVSGVVKPGQDLVELVPLQSKLLVEVKIKPQDIAFIYSGQKAIVKFSAFDFSIFGGLEGKVVHISADTIKDEENNRFYKVRILTNQSSFIHKEQELKIIPGMTVNVDILTGKKTVLEYILKPILKAKQYAFTQR